MDSEIEVISTITDRKTIAVGRSIREHHRLQKMYGRGRWRKLKGEATVRLPDNTTAFAEIHGMKLMELEGKILRSNVF